MLSFDIVTSDVAYVPQCVVGPQRHSDRPDRKRILGLQRPAFHSRALPLRGSTGICFKGGDDRPHKRGHLGRAADASSLDSRADASLDHDVRECFHAYAVFSSRACDVTVKKMLCHECLRAAERADTSRLQLFEAERQVARSKAHHRDHYRSIASSSFRCVAVASTVRLARSQSGSSIG